MLEVRGSDHNKDEYKAAQKLASLIRKDWPHIDKSLNDNVWIISNVLCYGHKPEDVDVLVLVSLDTPKNIKMFRDASYIELQYFGFVVEYKRMGLRGLSASDQDIDIKYSNTDLDDNRGEYGIVNRGRAQMFSVINYLKAYNIAAPHLEYLVWLDRVKSNQLPKRPVPVVCNDSSWNEMLERVALMASKASDKTPRRSSVVKEIERAVRHFTEKIVPSPLDRRKLEAITQISAGTQQLINDVRQKMLIIRGYSGSGKTALLLNLAYQLYEREEARIVLLSYNRALIADIRRLLHILHGENISLLYNLRLTSAHSFFGQIMRYFGVISGKLAGNEFIEKYDYFKKQLLQYFKEGLISAEDVEKLKNNQDFDWEIVMIDEAQDWPDDERELLLRIYGETRLVLADGIDQLVRQNLPTKWRANIPSGKTKVTSQPKSLRIACDIVLVLRSLATYMNIRWDLQENLDIQGGRIVVVEGSYIDVPELHAELVERHKYSGNELVDMLFCVPPDPARKRPRGKSVPAAITEWLMKHGHKVWDGTIPRVRDTTYPLELDEIRVVQYDSSRGLEGWTVVLLGLDNFASYKSGIFQAPEGVSVERQVFLHLEFISRWLMIPLTRSIHTLVIEVQDLDHPVTHALKHVSQQHPEIVEWRKSSS